MTAIPVDDATLARGVAAGDPASLAAVYDRYGGRLLGFCQNMLRRRADAEDCLQDVFVIAATRLSDLREPALLRSWLFSVARHECLARLDKSKREYLMDDVPDRASVDLDEPANAAFDTDLAALLADANQGLSDRDRLLLELADRQQLSGDELADAIGVPRSTAYTLVARARTTARKSLGALLVARTGRQRCGELDGLLTGWDGALTTLRRKQIARHIEKCSICTEQQRRVATPAALLGEGTAFAADLVALRLRVLTAAAAALPIRPPGGGGWVDGWPPVDPVFGTRKRRWRIPLAALFGLVLLGGGSVVWANNTGPTAPVSISTVDAPASTASTRSATSSPSPTPTSVPSTTSTPPSATPTPTPSSSTSRVHVTVTRTVVTTKPSSTPTTSAPSTTWTLTVVTDQDQATVVYDPTGAGTFCAAGRTTCTYSIPKGRTVTISSDRYETYSAPPSCAADPEGQANPCMFTITANLTVTLTSHAVIQ